jgi:hypothetical protein
MNYFTPYLDNWLTDDAGKDLARQSVTALDALNEHLAADYAAFGAPTAGVARRFAVDDFTTMVDSPWGRIPVNVFNTCTWLNVTCRVGGPQGFGDDANAAGYRVIAAAFEETIDLTTAPTTTTTTPAPAPAHPTAPPPSIPTMPPVPVSAAPTFTG